LIDFDWSGRVGVVKYPPTLNTGEEIKWTKRVELATTIQPKHMLEKIIDGTDVILQRHSAWSSTKPIPPFYPSSFSYLHDDISNTFLKL